MSCLPCNGRSDQRCCLSNANYCCRPNQDNYFIGNTWDNKLSWDNGITIVYFDNWITTPSFGYGVMLWNRAGCIAVDSCGKWIIDQNQHEYYICEDSPEPLAGKKGSKYKCNAT